MPPSKEWLERAQEAIDQQVDADVLAALREEAAGRLAELETAITDINERLRLAADRFRLPVISVPTAEIDEDAIRQALVSFDDDFVEASRALIARKSYGA